VIAAIAAGDPAGIAATYDTYAAALYGYCHWMLRQPTAAAEALQDTFVIAAITLGDLSEALKLRPWLYAVARNECLRRLRKPPSAHVEEADARDQGAETASQQIDIAYRPADATLPMRTVRQPVGPAHQFADATMPMQAVPQPTGKVDGLTGVNGGLGQADLAMLVRTILAELKPREREVIVLNLRHDLDDADLAIALGVSWSKAHTRAARARGRLEKALGALVIARTGREACRELDKLLSDWDGQLTEKKRDLVSRHIDKCETCASDKFGKLRPAAVSRMLPLVELPSQLREHILVMCSSATPDAVAYRRRAVRRAESKWSGRFEPAIRRLSWRTFGSSSKSATVTIALAVWVVAVWVVAMTLLMFTGPHSSHAVTARPSIRAPLPSPAAAAVTTTAPTAAPTSASAGPSRTAIPSPTYVAPLYVPPPPSHSPKPSKSPSASSSRSGSPSPSSSRTTSPSASPSKTP
jgi:RNA polymerase sigma factor (sigma-70 family)